MFTIRRHNGLLKSLLISALILSPSLALEGFLLQNRVELNAPYLAACIIVFLAVMNFLTILMIEPQWRKLSKFTFPAFLATIAVILMYMMVEALNRFVEYFGYGVLTPFVAACMLLIYITVFTEKNIVLKCYLSLNSVAITVLWMMGSVDKITMPF